MENRLHSTHGALLPIEHTGTDLQDVARFMQLCAATFKNILSCCPFKLKLDKVKFLHFQQDYEHLHSLLESSSFSPDDLQIYLRGLENRYEALMADCWQAFVDDKDVDSDPRKFVIRQLELVDDYNNRVH